MMTIHSVVDFAGRTFKKRNAPKFVIRWGPSLVGLSLLPALPIVFDDPVESLIEKAFDKFWPIAGGHSN